MTITILISLTIIVVGCNNTSPTTETKPVPTQDIVEPETQSIDEPQTIVMMGHDSFNATSEVIAEFEKVHNVKFEYLPSGDTGAALNQAILAKDAPLADLFFGIDNTFLSRAFEPGLFEPYDSPELANIPDVLKLDPENRLLPVDYGDVCLNYDKGWFAEKGLAPPTTLEDLLKPEYKGLTVVQNPATSSPGLAFLMATVAQFGDKGYLDFWQAMVEQDVLVTNGWEEAYYGEFTRYDGLRPLVVSYASSPPVEVIFAEEPSEEAPTASVVGDLACFRQIEFIGILGGTEKRDLAEKLVDFLLSKPFQEDIPLNMFVFPSNRQAELPSEFQLHAQISDNPATLPPEEIAANREAWIKAWTETVLR